MKQAADLRARMSALPTALARLRRGFDARNRRERMLLIGAAVAVIWMLSDALWVSPSLAAWKAAGEREAQARTTLAALQDAVTQRAVAARDAERRQREALDDLRQRVARGEERLRAAGATLVGARDMVPVLDRLLERTGGLRMLSMQTLAAVPVTPAGSVAPAAAAASAPVEPAGTLYRHGVELTVEGRYTDLLAYVRAIESLPQRVLWGGLELKVERHPAVQLTLRLYTLSPDREWLEI